MKNALSVLSVFVLVLAAILFGLCVAKGAHGWATLNFLTAIGAAQLFRVARRL